MANSVNRKLSTREFTPTSNEETEVGLTRKASVSVENMAESDGVSDVIVTHGDEIIISQNILINQSDVSQSSNQDITLNNTSVKRECVEGEINSSLTLLHRKHKNIFSEDWKEAAQQLILHVYCRKITGELHKNRFGSGAKGKSICVGKVWFTPSEFEAHCGRSASKDWKRSIRFQGQTLQALIENEYLQVHASSCSCAICLEDSLAGGPIRLYQHCKRRKRLRVDEVKECEAEPYPSCKTTITLPVSDITSLNSSSTNVATIDEVDVEISPLQPEISLDKSWEQMNEVIKSLERKISKAREMFDHLRNKTLREMEDQRQVLIEEKEDAIHRAKLEAHYSSVDRRTDDEFLVEVEPGEEENGEEEVNSSTVLQPVMIDDLTTSTPDLLVTHLKKKCVNCNRDCSNECSSCRRKWYCSSFCQRRDWSSHRNECGAFRSSIARDSSRYIFMLSE